MGHLHGRGEGAGPDRRGPALKSPFFLPSLLLLLQAAWAADPEPYSGVVPGIEVLVAKQLPLVSGKKVGLLTHPSGVDRRMRPTFDILRETPGITLTTLFSPEHGFFGGKMNPEGDWVEPGRGLPVYNLEGASRRPTDRMLRNVEVLVVDLQDIGVRSYTYVSTLRYCMEEAGKRGIPVVVLDRPNPINGITVDGPMLDPRFVSFISALPVPYVHGMTIGEMAFFMKDQMGISCQLHVVPMEGWRREMSWKDTGLPWVPPSPHIPEPDSPWFYAMTGILGELGLVNVGVGYTLPFKLVGAPWLDADVFSKAMNDMALPGVYFQPFHYTPLYWGFKDTACRGSRIVLLDPKTVKPVHTCYAIIETLLRMYPQRFDFETERARKNRDMFDKANGTDAVRRMLSAGQTARDIADSFRPALEDFMRKREKYLLYPPRQETSPDKAGPDQTAAQETAPPQ